MSVTPSGACNYTHLSANGTTTIKSGAGMLVNVTINSKGSSSNSLTLYDNTSGSGTVIAVIDSTAQIQVLNYSVAFTTGLTAVVASGTAGDFTIGWF
jgi:hypothetical protein